MMQPKCHHPRYCRVFHLAAACAARTRWLWLSCCWHWQGVRSATLFCLFSIAMPCAVTTLIRAARALQAGLDITRTLGTGTTRGRSRLQRQPHQSTYQVRRANNKIQNQNSVTLTDGAAASAGVIGSGAGSGAGGIELFKLIASQSNTFWRRLRGALHSVSALDSIWKNSVSM